MTIKESVFAALNDWRNNAAFNIEDASAEIETLVDDAITEWALGNGFQWSEAEWQWEPKPEA